MHESPCRSTMPSRRLKSALVGQILRAGRLVALVAEDREEEAARVGKGAFLDGLDPAAIDADRNLVLGLAGDGAGVTADAFSKIDGEPVVGHAGLRIYHALTDRKATEITETTETRDTRSAESHDRPAEPVGAGRERGTPTRADTSRLTSAMPSLSMHAASRRRATLPITRRVA